MAMIAGGIVTLKPVGGIISNNPAMNAAQAQAATQKADERAAQHQAKLDTFINKVVDNQRGEDNKPRWTVPFK